MYDLVLFVHISTIAAAFFVIGIIVSALIRLRGVRDGASALSAASTAAAAGKIMPLATVSLLLTGAYMTHARWSWTTPWIDVSIAGLLIVTAMGAGVIGSRERALHCALHAAGNGPIDAATTVRMCDPMLVAGTMINVGLVCAVMFVMVVKPSLVVAIVVVGAGAACGAVAGMTTLRPAPALRNAAADP